MRFGIIYHHPPSEISCQAGRGRVGPGGEWKSKIIFPRLQIDIRQLRQPPSLQTLKQENYSQGVALEEEHFCKKNRLKGLGHQRANLASKSYIGSLEQNESSSGLGL